MGRLNTRALTGIAVVLLLLGGEALAEGEFLVDSVNADKNPYLTASWAAKEIGWYYIPGFSYDLVRIETKFGAFTDSRLATLEIYDRHPEDGVCYCVGRISHG